MASKNSFNEQEMLDEEIKECLSNSMKKFSTRLQGVTDKYKNKMEDLSLNFTKHILNFNRQKN